MTTNIKDLIEKTKSIVKKRDHEIANLKNELRSAKSENHVIFKGPDTVKVSNLPEVQKVKVEGQPEVQKVSIQNIEDLKVEIKESTPASKWVPSVVVMAVKGISNMCVRLWNSGITVRLASEERLMPLPVIVVDSRGRPVSFGGSNAVAFMPGSQSNASGVIPTGSVIGSGRQTVGTPGDVVKLATLVTPCRKVIITSIPTNQGLIAVGDLLANAQSGSERGMQLIGSFATVTIDIDDVSKIYIDASIAGEGVSFTYLR